MVAVKGCDQACVPQKGIVIGLYRLHLILLLQQYQFVPAPYKFRILFRDIVGCLYSRFHSRYKEEIRGSLRKHEDSRYVRV